MAKVSPAVEAQIERYLAYLCAEWADVPGISREWPTLAPAERRSFIAEWPIREDRLLELRKYADSGLLTTVQRATYDELLAMVHQYRPLLERMLEG
jgi:hypothetical protein